MADGLTAELIGRLSRFQGLAKVVGRDSLMRYRHATKSLREIAQELDVDAVISGSVTRSRDNVRITVGLAAAYCVLGRRGDFPARQAFSMAKAAALRSLQLDPFLPDGYSALGTAVLHYDWDWAGAGRAHGRAVELNPNSSQVRFAYGEYLRFEWPLG
ncbi:MAG TPA: hypothetical protein VK886_14210 [Vicinamibacterales bacterium]|nr:hypothetical protein [Vicinamibacterales bacterium]